MNNGLNFNQYPISEDLLKATTLLGYESPTPVQAALLPRALEGRDVIVRSRTGSGKTVAFGLPLLEQVDWALNPPQALVVVPTRELAVQVGQDLFQLGRFKRIKVATVFGKSPFSKQAKTLKEKTHVVVGTPGRLLDHMERGTLPVSSIRMLVVDEADELLNMGFIDQVRALMDRLPRKRQTLLLSATMPEDIESLCAAYMDAPIKVEIEDTTEETASMTEMLYVMEPKDKAVRLKELLMVENPDSAMIFCNTQETVESVYERLRTLRYPALRIHGGMLQEERLEVMQAFRRGQGRFLVATDVAARGIDIPDVALVVNYDIPREPERYVHRIGRTGRIGKEGRALLFMAPWEVKYLEAIEAYAGRGIPRAKAPGKEAVIAAKGAFREKMEAPLPERTQKGAALEEDIVKLHINAGKKDKLRPVDIVGTLCSLQDMGAEDIGIIQVEDHFALVEVLHGKGPRVLKALQEKPIKGKKRRVQRAVASR